VPATIRPATVDDVESFVAMKNDAWRWAYAGLLPDDYLASLSVDAQAGFWRTAIASRERVGDVLLAVDDDGRVLGVASWGASRDDDATSLTGELDVLYVAADHVGTGLGRQLMDEALDGLRRAGSGARHSGSCRRTLGAVASTSTLVGSLTACAPMRSSSAPTIRWCAT